MNVHEYQAKELLKSFHISVPFGVCVKENTPSAIAAVLKAFKDRPKVAVKAQIHAGGRGKGHFKENGTSGVRLVETEHAAEVVADMFGNPVCQQGIAMQQETALGDTVGLIVELLGI